MLNPRPDFPVKTGPLLVIDLESTCWEDQTTPAGEPQSVDNMEIIEIGCALATRSGELLDSASFMVRPVRFPHLSRFCTSLTGITQTMVDTAPIYTGATEALNRWLGQPASDFIWCSWGNYDRLHVEAQNRETGARPVFSHFPHLNLKRIWRLSTGQKKKNGLVNALAFHHLAFEGSPHRGVDDARNIVRLLPFIDWHRENNLLTRP